MNRIRIAGAVLCSALLVSAAQATWSIIITDSRTGEIALGSATCVERINLQRDTPVVRVGVGAATAQSFVDTTGTNRGIIWEQLALGTAPADILTVLRQNEGRNNHNSRQYGIVDTRGRAATFSGNRNGSFAGGATGTVGTIHYAVQGNVITGQPMVDAMAFAVENTPGDLPEKLMAAMEAAYCFGGDGRCSCDEPRADDCGSPPTGFSCDGDLTLNPKTADVGYLIVARRGDIDGDCNTQGCATGDYWFNRNVKNTVRSDPDPVFTLRSRYDIWRNNQRGRLDQVQSIVTLSDARAMPGDAQAITMRIELRDWEGQPATGIEEVEVLHDPDGGNASSQIGNVVVVDGTNQVYEVTITSGSDVGVDELAVRVTYEGEQQRFLMPNAQLAIQDPRGDFNADGSVDLADLGVLLGNFGSSGPGDFDENGIVNLTDLAELLITPGLGSLN